MRVVIDKIEGPPGTNSAIVTGEGTHQQRPGTALLKHHFGKRRRLFIPHVLEPLAQSRAKVALRQNISSNGIMHNGGRVK